MKISSTSKSLPPLRLKPTAVSWGSRLSRLLAAIRGCWSYRPVGAAIRRYFKAIFAGYAGVFFLQSSWLGILLVAVSLYNFNLGLAGMISVGTTLIFARLINMGRDRLRHDCYIYNPLLVGLAIGYFFKLTPLTISFLVISALLAFILTFALFSISSYYLKLPILSLPFVLASWVALFASPQYSRLPWVDFTSAPISLLEAYLPFWLSGYLKALGAIFFLPAVLPGLLLAVVILAASRILFLLSLAGYLTGSLFTAWLVGSSAQAFTNINHFNFILIAMAVGGTFLVPSPRSYLLALLAVAISTIVLNAAQTFCGLYKIPVLALPFNLVTLAFIYVLGLVNYPQVAKLIKSSPEETLDLHLANRRRFQGSNRTLALPFSGKWRVWQGFDGDWTHQQDWKYAYDFIITDARGSSHKNAGAALSDYYAFHKPVLAPVDGKVQQVVNNLPDNPIGQVDKINNWGNHVIIQDERGFFVEISHFAEGSIQVKEGQQVERGALLGLCGNSGYSPQPHIHIQVQECGLVGSFTIPFSFENYVEDKHYHATGSPAVAAEVEALNGERTLEAQTSLKVGEAYPYEVWRDGRQMATLTLTVKIAPDGTRYLDSGRGRLYFGKQDGSFYFYSMEGQDPYLRTIFAALPRFPLACRALLQWQDHLPVGLITSGLTKATLQFIRSLAPEWAESRTELICVDQDTFAGKIELPALKLEKEIWVAWDEHPGFKTLQVDGLEIRRIRKIC